MSAKDRPGVYEFFAGGGMARAGLGEAWETLFANDFSPMKGAAYADNWGSEALHVGDVFALSADDLPGRASLAWASSPCQDLSLAGKRSGLDGARSGAFFGFWRLIVGLDAQGRAPPLIVIENVTGLFSSNGGADFVALCQALSDRGYLFGALEMDAADFTPQSRPRLFVVATRRPTEGLTSSAPDLPFHTRRLVNAYERLPDRLKASWCWWRLPAPPRRNQTLIDILEPDDSVRWHDAAETNRLLGLLGPLHLERLEQVKARGVRTAGALYRRTRPSPEGRVQRAEARFDGLAGCLRTPGGGSSRQFIAVAADGRVRTRALTPRESARLMGLPDTYRLPSHATAALHLTGDGVAAPVVKWLSEHLLAPLSGETKVRSRSILPDELAAHSSI